LGLALLEQMGRPLSHRDEVPGPLQLAVGEGAHQLAGRCLLPPPAEVRGGHPTKICKEISGLAATWRFFCFYRSTVLLSGKMGVNFGLIQALEYFAAPYHAWAVLLPSASPPPVTRAFFRVSAPLWTGRLPSIGDWTILGTGNSPVARFLHGRSAALCYRSRAVFSQVPRLI